MYKVNNIHARTKHLSENINTHSHNHYQIIFGLNGYAEFNIGGVEGYIQEGVGCIVPSNVIHDFFGDKNNKILILDVAPNLSILEFETAFTSNTLSCLLDSPKYFHYDQKMNQLIVSLSEEVQQIDDDSTLPSLIGQCLLHSLYHRLREEISIKQVASSDNRINVGRIKNYIYDNLSEKIQIADLAKLCNISESHFHQKFRNIVGISPYQYVIDERVNIACDMLKKSDKSVTDICFTLGFSSQSAFTNFFRKKIGCSPTCYRKNT